MAPLPLVLFFLCFFFGFFTHLPWRLTFGFLHLIRLTLPPLPLKVPICGGGAGTVPGPWHSSLAAQSGSGGIWRNPPPARAS